VCPPDLAYRSKRRKGTSAAVFPPIQDFILTKCIISEDGYISINDLYQAYQSHISSGSFNINEIEEEMNKLGYQKDSDYRYRGLKLLSSEAITDYPPPFDYIHM